MSSKVQYVSKSFSKISDLLDNKKKRKPLSQMLYNNKTIASAVSSHSRPTPKTTRLALERAKNHSHAARLFNVSALAVIQPFCVCACNMALWKVEKNSRLFFNYVYTPSESEKEKKKTFRVLLFVFSLAVRVTNPPAVQLNYASDSNTFPNDY